MLRLVTILRLLSGPVWSLHINIVVCTSSFMAEFFSSLILYVCCIGHSKSEAVKIILFLSLP